METRAHHIIVGAFVLTMLVGIFASIVWLARVQFEREGQRYDIFFRGSVNGLVDGAPVRYHGVSIGRVVTIRLDPENIERVRVRVEVDSRTPIKQDAVASLELQGITGQAYVQISGGSNASPVLVKEDDRPYPVIPSKPSGLEEVVSSAPQLLKRLLEVSDRLNEMLGEGNRQKVASVLGNLEQMSGNLARESADIGTLVQAGLGTVNELRQAAASANHLVGRLDEAIGGRNGVADKLGGTLDEVGKATRTLAQTTEHLDALLQESRPGLRDFTQRGLGQIQQLVTDARALVAQLTRVAESVERDPSRFLYGDRRQGYKPQ